MASQSSRPPNILFIWTDEQRPDTIGAYGNEAIRTPNIDRLAADGVLFEQAYCAQPVCSPARASILTGLHPHTHGVYGNNVPLGSRFPTLATELRSAGYACGYVGKWHLGDEAGRTPEGRSGFDDFWVSIEDSYVREHATEGYTSYHDFLVGHGYISADPHRDGTIFNRYTAAKMPEVHSKPAFQAAESIRFLEQFQDRAFFLSVNFLEPHMPFWGAWDDLYAAEDMTLPETWYRELEPTVPLRYRLRQQAFMNDPKPSLAFYDLETNDERGWKALKARYWGLASLVDKYVGQILDRLEQLGLADNTIVVYTTDHGDMMGEHHMIHKGVQFEGATHVPLIVRAPDVMARRVKTPVSHVGLMPTLLELVGHPIPIGVQGHSLAPLLIAGDAAPDEAQVVVEWNGTSGYTGTLTIPTPPNLSEEDQLRLNTLAARTLRRGRWKLTMNASGEHELYDLHDDPGETHNAFNDSASRAIVDELYERLLDWQRETSDPLVLPHPSTALDSPIR